MSHIQTPGPSHKYETTTCNAKWLQVKKCPEVYQPGDQQLVKFEVGIKTNEQTNKLTMIQAPLGSILERQGKRSPRREPSTKVYAAFYCTRKDMPTIGDSHQLTEIMKPGVMKCILKNLLITPIRTVEAAPRLWPCKGPTRSQTSISIHGTRTNSPSTPGGIRHMGVLPRSQPARSYRRKNPGQTTATSSLWAGNVAVARFIVKTPY